MTDPVEQKEWAEGLRDEIQAAILNALLVEPGMGGMAEPVWETYLPEGVAIVLTEAVLKCPAVVERLTEAVRLLRQNHSDLLRALDVHGGGSLCETCSFLAALSPLPSERKGP